LLNSGVWQIRVSSSVIGKIRNPPKASVTIAMLGEARAARAADIAHKTDATSCPWNPPAKCARISFCASVIFTMYFMPDAKMTAKAVGASV